MNKIVAIGLVLILSACGNVTNGVATTQTGFGGHVTEFKTADGLDCVFAKSGNGGGLSCNWQAFNSK